MKKLSIIIPCYNEEKTIEELLNKVIDVELPENWKKEIIVVDDGSKDKTREILKKYKDKAKIVFKNKNEGKGSAIKEGFKYVTGDYILIQDADLEYDPNDYKKLLEPIDKNEAQIVIGVRKFNKFRLFYFGGKLLTKIFNFFIGSNFSDNATCYKLFPKSLVSKLLKYKENNFVFDNVCLSYEFFKSGLKIKEVEINYNPREKGKKIKIKDGFFILVKILDIYSKTKKGENTIKILSVVLIISIYTLLAINNIGSPFLHISEDNNGLYGVAVINWLNKGIINLKFGMYGTNFIDNNFDPNNFYTHHPSFFLIPTYIFYKFFGISEVTTRLSIFFVYLISLIIFYFALSKIFEEKYMPLLISLIFAILPASLYYGKLLETAVFGVPMGLITLSLFVFYKFNRSKLNLILFFLSILFGGLTNWFYYFMPFSIWLYVMFCTDFKKNEKNNLLFFIPIFTIFVFLLNFLHFYILKGANFYKDLKDVFHTRTGNIPFTLWLFSIWNRLSLNFTIFFLITSFIGFILFIKNFKNFHILLPLILFPLSNLFVFKQWSTHPYGVIFFSGAIASLTGLIFYESFKKNLSLGIFFVILIFSLGYYFSSKNMNNFYNKLLILGSKDIEFLKLIKDKVNSYDVCEAKNDLGIGFDGIIQWYIRKSILKSPECINKSKIILIGNPNFGKFYQDELTSFLNNSYKFIGCLDFWCVLEK
jgi:glycosyltransferase involved in cell wall biosynthesis